MTYIERMDYQRSLRQMLCTFAADFFVTANFNMHALSYTTAKEKLKRFHAVIDHKLLGKHWCRLPDGRTRFVAVPETKFDKLHYHMLVKVADLSNHCRFQEIAPNLFRHRSISVGGSLDIRPIRTETDHQAVADYMTKDCYREDQIENYVLSSEFVNSQRACE